MDKIKKIRQEIGRLKGLLKNSNYYLDNSEQAVGYESALDDLNEFIGNLSEEPSESLEEAARLYATEWHENPDGSAWKPYFEESAIKAFKAGAEWMADHFEKERLRDCDDLTPEDAQLEDAFVESHFKKNQRTPTFIDAIKYGAELQKSQMMEETVEGYVNYYEDSGGILMAEAQVGCPYHNGDKIRIIIVKEENK